MHASLKSEDLSSAEAVFGIRLGAVYDYLIQENYYISTGMSYSLQHVAIKNKISSPAIHEQHALRYLQIPLLLKLYTSELMLDTRLYAAIGVIGQLNVGDSKTTLHDSQTTLFIESLRRWGLAGLLGVGVDYATSLSSRVFVGMSYQCGISNVIAQQAQHVSVSKVTSYSDLLSIDLGVIF